VHQVLPKLGREHQRASFDRPTASIAGFYKTHRGLLGALLHLFELRFCTSLHIVDMLEFID
jgi:hypothetical protein